jgi:murein DD-endopeptidase MepM/ murein hydrolase activator NlpD
MKQNRPSGLALGLLLAILTMWIAAGGTQPLGRMPLFAPDLPTDTAKPPSASAGTETTAMPGPTATMAPTEATSSPAARPSSTGPATAVSARTESPAPSATALPPAAARATVVEKVIGSSVMGQPLTAYGLGQGEIKVILVGDIHGGYEANTYELARQLLVHFEAHPDEVPAQVSLWILPTINPDGLESDGRWNANDVDLNRNADTSLDGCAGNDWSPDTMDYEGLHPEAGGDYPFSEPETLALRDFAADARIVVFYHSAYGGIFPDACRQHLPTARLAEVLSTGTGYPVPAEGWTGYPVTGDFGDYLAGEGVAAVTVELTDHDDPEFERNLSGVRAVLSAAQEIVTAEVAAVGGQHTWLAPDPEGNLGTWHYPENSFVHPLALEVIGDTGYLLDGGRILALDLVQPAPPEPILAPGDYVDNARVLEPLDLAADGDSLLVLDRAGDVYRYQPEIATWSMARYDRPAGDTYDHYFVALAGGEGAAYLLETTHEQVWRFLEGEKGAPWANVPKGRDVDLCVGTEGVSVLTRGLNSPSGGLLRYVAGQGTSAFQPNLALMHPRQVTSGGTSLYVLDRAGRRLLALDPQSGALQTAYEFANRQPVSTVWARPDGDEEPGSATLILAGRDTLYFYRQPERQAVIEGRSASSPMSQPADPALLEGLRGLQMPITGATLTSRDFQMPGAPRHYRLGVHEGMDFYGHTVGVTVNRQTKVRAVADGVVIRALVDYQPLTAATSAAWQERCLALGYTPDEVLDGYRGRQVWIDHGQGLVSRYAHLGSITPGIVEGVRVSQGQVIATVGNSGTPGSVTSQTYDVHLHLELWIGDHYIGQFLRPIEAREWLERILR